MTNKGVYPLDPETPVGNLRLLLGDTNSVPRVPDEVGFQDYSMFSDDELEAFLISGETTEGAAYLAYMQLAGAAAMESKSVKDQDLSVDLSKRATDLRLVAVMWKDRADAISADIFELFDTVDTGCYCSPEASARVVCCGRRFF